MNTVLKPTYVRPNIDRNDHPVLSEDYAICTNSTYKMMKTILGWIEVRQPGGMIYGAPRLGKSKSIEFISKYLETLYDNTLPVLIFECYKHHLPSENMFYQEMLDTVNHAYAEKGNSGQKRSRLRDYFLSIAMKNKHKRIVIFFDEAQNFGEQQYKWLINVYNDLKRKRVKPTFIMVGQSELLALRDTFVTKHNKQIVGRFLLNVHKFRGITGAADIEVCLRAFDDNATTEYPAGSGCSFTEYFFPIAYKHGWRLQDQAETVWKAFSEVKQKYKLPTSEISMNFFFGALNYVLLKHENLIDIEPHLSLNIWKEAVEQSGYSQSGVLVEGE